MTTKRRCVVVDIPGLIGRYVPLMPSLASYAKRGQTVPVRSIAPTLNCSAQATMLTGVFPREHGIVGDGWLHRDIAEVRFWPQTATTLEHPTIWETARAIDPSFSGAGLCLFMNMYGACDWSVTPQPHFAADGRLIPGLFTQPEGLANSLIEVLGEFPIYDWWGPRVSIRSSRWIVDAARFVEEQQRPDLCMFFLPHLDYAPHADGPEPQQMRAALRELDQLLGPMLQFYTERDVTVVFVSEYGVVPVSRPVHLNRRFRQRGWLGIRHVDNREVLHVGASEAFAVADMQIAHIYVRDPDRIAEVRALVEAEPGVAEVLDEAGKRARGLDHPRSGELVALAEPDAWFTYYFWLDDRRAPDYARTIDIFRKPGYDPIELFLDRKLSHGREGLQLALALAQDRCGLRRTIELVPLDAGLLRGAHGVTPPPEYAPVLITPRADLLADKSELAMVEIHDLLLAHLGLELATQANHDKHDNQASQGDHA